MMDDLSPVAETEPSTRVPFFVIGAERSGTTLLRLMMDHHPQIRLSIEADFMVDYLTSDGDDPDPAWLKQSLALDPWILLHGFEFREGYSFKEEVREFLLKDVEQVDKKAFGVAIHRRFSKTLLYWPNARFLNLTRDPRDVAKSVIAMGWAGNTWHGSKQWLQAQAEAQELRRTLPPDRWLEIHFEDLVSEPVATLSRICEFLGFTYDPAMLTYPAHTTYSAPDSSAAWRWKKKLTRNEIRLVEAQVGDWLQASGYELSGEPKLKVGPWRRLFLHMQNRVYKIRFRCQRHGTRTVILFVLASKLGMIKVVDRLQSKMNERNNALWR
jgi:sulfotransferase family protein